MNIVATPTYTPEDLLEMPGGKGFELVDGNLVATNSSARSSWVGGQVHGLLDGHVQAGHLGTVWPATLGVQCFPDAPGKVRRPDASFIARDRYALDQLSDGFLHIAPDLVVEVISPNDLAKDVEKKVEEDLGAGVRLVWVVDPDTRTVRIDRADGSAARLRQGDELSGEDVVPGFRCPVRDLFPPPARGS
jgi:Uma2 family endonuclease